MQIITDRRALHRIPELEFSLENTMAYLRHSLSGLSCRVYAPIEGALAAFFDFGAADTVAFRADADALPIAEKTGADYASRHPGAMHACGHDGHMAILLELARRLDRMSSLPHNVLLLFQPAEESTGGAYPLCKTGILEEHRVKAIFGLHLWPGLEAGCVYSRQGALMARASEVTVDLYGKSAHIAKASQGIDSLAAGAFFYDRCMALEQSLPREEFRLLKFGKFLSGTARNALSAHTHMEGSLRAFREPVFDRLKDGITAIARQTEETFGCRVQLHFSEGYPAVWNPEELYTKVRSIFPFRELEEPFMTAEDFSWYQQYVPGVFFFLGLGDTPALHADTFDFDDRLLTAGADFFTALAQNPL